MAALQSIMRDASASRLGDRLPEDRRPAGFTLEIGVKPSDTPAADVVMGEGGVDGKDALDGDEPMGDVMIDDDLGDEDDDEELIDEEE